MNAPSNHPRMAALFKSNRNQAVRLPKDFEFPEGLDKVVVRKVGESVVLTPIKALWDDFFDREPNPDFPDREQPAAQERDFDF